MTGRKKKSDAFKIYPKNSVVEEPIMNEEKKIKKTRKKKETVEKIDTIEFIQNGKITEFIPSKYQNDIWDFVKHGVGNAVVEANAGCAKTSTIVNAIRLIPESLKILFVAFNRDIVKELESKIRAFESENVEIKTLHSLGYSLLRRNFKEINFQLDEYKYRTFIKHNIKELTPIDLTEFSKSDYNSYIDNITTLTDLARYNLAQSEKELSVISDRHGIIPLKDEMAVVLKILEWGKENIDTIDYTDMVWLPYELNLKPLGLTYDWIFIDECFPYDQYISTDNGKVKIGSLYNMFINNKQLPLAKSYNETTKTFEYKRILNVWNRGEKELIEITVGNKRKIKTTINERFLTDKGYKYASDLNGNDYLLSSCKSQPYHAFLNDEIKDVFKIHLIGDGNIHKVSNGIYRIRITHGEKQKEYLDWKASLFGVNNIDYIKENGFSKKPAYRFNSLGYCINDDELNIETVIKNMTLKQLAINYQDNGSYNKKCCCIYSCVHNYKHISLLKERIEELGIFGVKIKQSKSSTSGKIYYYLTIDVENSYVLHSKIAKYVNKSLSYKIHEDFKDEIGTYEWDMTEIIYGGMPVTNIKNLNRRETVYDLEVEDNHNFIIPSSSFNTKYTNNAINEGFIVHNCQDLNVAQRELFLRCFKKGTRFVAVGDKNQAIYSFAGADKESFDKLKSLPNTISLPLSISYRCPKRVIKLAQTFVPSIQARDDAPEGSIEYNKSIQDVQSGDMVLCRNKMPLVTVYMRYLRMGKKAFIRGKDIGLNLIKMLDKTEQSILNQDMKSDGVFVRLYDSLFEARNQLMLKRGLDLEDATLSETILTMYDNIKALETMSEGLSNVTQLKMRINNVFAENSDGICLSTVHKAKGLEADNVYILCKSLMPSRNAKQDWELEQELNLQYVAYTRAKSMLAFISEKEISPMAGLIDTSVVKTELSYIETVVNKILGKKTDSMMDEETFLKMKIKDATVIEEPKVNVKTLDSPSNNSDDEEEDYQEIINLLKKKGGLKKLKEFLVK